MYFFDPMFFLIIAPALLLALVAQYMVKSAYSQMSQVPARMTGYEAARRILDAYRLHDVEIEQVVKMTEGFSGRAISKLAIAWQAAAYGTEGAVLNKASFFQTVENHKSSMLIKDEWLVHAEKRANMLTLDQK